MSSLVQKLRTGAAWYERFGKVLIYVTGFIIILMAVTTFYEVIARYFFNAPTIWSFELNENFLLYLAFLGGAYTLAVGGYVRVDVLYARWPPKRRAAVDMITFLVALFFVIILIWQGGRMAFSSLEVGARSVQALRWPLFPLQIMIPIGGVLIGLQMVIKIVRDIHLVFFSTSPKSGDSQ